MKHREIPSPKTLDTSFIYPDWLCWSSTQLQKHCCVECAVFGRKQNKRKFFPGFLPANFSMDISTNKLLSMGVEIKTTRCGDRRVLMKLQLTPRARLPWLSISRKNITACASKRFLSPIEPGKSEGCAQSRCSPGPAAGLSNTFPNP